MATVSIIIEDSGVPVVGAEVFAGEMVAKALITDETGAITKTVPDDFAVAVAIIVEVGGVRLGVFSPILLKAENTITLDIGGAS